ncbi:hypothetical protein J2T13_002598 [Paenibacillus sp. DS2015]|uniref:hypothetical protein n=1 Tax=Paenibacillus sp. DS2015 TaxID=3373917 RepID=UPI003D233444
MSKNKTWIIMIWITILTVWTVSNLTTSLNNQRSVNVQGIPLQIQPSISTVQIDKDTVWLIDANTNYIRVITHENDDYYITGSEMSFREK